MENETGRIEHPGRLPSLFVAGGGPDQTDDAAWTEELGAWAKTLARPRSILIFSAHWEHSPIAIGPTRTVPLLYDFFGFPERYYRVNYPAPGAPALAERVRDLLRGAGTPFTEAPERGLDHGAYVPLLGLYPGANVPVLQLSLPGLDPRRLFALGRTLAPLRDEGVLVVGAGLLIHNMQAMATAAVRLRQETQGLDSWITALRTKAGPIPSWAQEFDAWVAEVLEHRDWDALLDYRVRAPAVRLALPTHEHFVPLIVAAGAAEREAVRFPITGFVYGLATRRSAQFG